MNNGKCFHCGNEIKIQEQILFDDKEFCCAGCKTVYEIFSQNNLSCYYDYEANPGATPHDIEGKYDFLDNSEISIKLLEFHEDTTSIISLHIPHIHCSSCIWILENLQKLSLGIISSQVDFPKKKVRISFHHHEVSLKEIVYLLSSIGYEPYISLENYDVSKENIDRSLIYKIGIAFFCFGNVMLLSFPEYFEVEEYWIDQYRDFFRWLIFAISLPAFFYSASSYYVSAWKSIKSRMLNIDIPIALGIIVMFIRSSVDIFFDLGQGFFDSMTGLIFFMLLGRLFQQKTYGFLSFERDYKSYFPVAVTRIKNHIEEAIQIYAIEKGDRLLIRNQELIPVDGILISQEASIDYSFVTGEAIPIQKKSGDKVFAGGKQMGKIVEIEVLHSVSQSYLTQLWSNDIFQKQFQVKHKNITDSMSRFFTPALLSLAFISFIYWLFIDINTAFNVFTAILIVACPCALALTAPFTLGNVLRIMGKRKFYLKNATVIEQMAAIDTLVFDKTGTLTSPKKSKIIFEGSLNDIEIKYLKNIIRGSNHPLSRRIYEYLPESEEVHIDTFAEFTGKGIQAVVENIHFKIGSESFVGLIENKNELQKTKVYIQINNIIRGQFIFENQYRKGLEKLFKNLNKNYVIKILSGDNEGEKNNLEQLLPHNIEMLFNQKPEEKLIFIKKLQQAGKKVMMIGDGLNDAGALKQSNVGISISENVNVFSPACDGILDATQFEKIDDYLLLSKNAMTTIYMSFGLSLIYNILGLGFAITGHLSPLIAAIIMPLSTITIVSFVTILSNFYARKK